MLSVTCYNVPKYKQGSLYCRIRQSPHEANGFVGHFHSILIVIRPTVHYHYQKFDNWFIKQKTLPLEIKRHLIIRKKKALGDPKIVVKKNLFSYSIFHILRVFSSYLFLFHHMMNLQKLTLSFTFPIAHLQFSV